MKSFQTSYEIMCEVCEANAARDTSTKGDPVINRASICVDLKGERVEASRLSALRPELASLPKMRLCPDHLKTQRHKDGGEWVTITEAAAMLARRDKKEMESLPPLVENIEVEESNVVSKLMNSLGVGASTEVPSVQTLLRRKIGK